VGAETSSKITWVNANLPQSLPTIHFASRRRSGVHLHLWYRRLHSYVPSQHDFSARLIGADNRKNLLILGIVLFGTFALPFASMTTKTYRNLVSGSILWVFMTTVQGIYGTLSSSYIPLFMREAGWIQTRTKLGQDGKLVVTEEERANKELFNRGTKVSVLGLLSGNVGSILGQGIGLIIAHSAGSGLTDGYKRFVSMRQSLMLTDSTQLPSCHHHRGLSYHFLWRYGLFPAAFCKGLKASDQELRWIGDQAMSVISERI
jgi:MFS family permease